MNRSDASTTPTWIATVRSTATVSANVAISTSTSLRGARKSRTNTCHSLMLYATTSRMPASVAIGIQPGPLAGREQDHEQHDRVHHPRHRACGRPCARWWPCARSRPSRGSRRTAATRGSRSPGRAARRSSDAARRSARRRRPRRAATRSPRAARSRPPGENSSGTCCQSIAGSRNDGSEDGTAPKRSCDRLDRQPEQVDERGRGEQRHERPGHARGDARPELDDRDRRERRSPRPRAGSSPSSG